MASSASGGVGEVSGGGGFNFNFSMSWGQKTAYESSVTRVHEYSIGSRPPPGHDPTTWA
jgi:hypothetical protein